MVTWLIALLSGGLVDASAPGAASATTPAPRVIGPVLKPSRQTARQPRTGSQRLSALMPPGDQTQSRATPFSFSAMEDERQRLRLGVKPGLSRARLGVDYRVTLDR